MLCHGSGGCCLVDSYSLISLDFRLPSSLSGEEASLEPVCGICPSRYRTLVSTVNENLDVTRCVITSCFVLASKSTPVRKDDWDECRYSITCRSRRSEVQQSAVSVLVGSLFYGYRQLAESRFERTQDLVYEKRPTRHKGI